MTTKIVGQSACDCLELQPVECSVCGGYVGDYDEKANRAKADERARVLALIHDMETGLMEMRVVYYGVEEHAARQETLRELKAKIQEVAQ